jgi:hypothetical protein
MFKIVILYSCCKKGFSISSVPSTGEINITAGPRQTINPSDLVSFNKRLSSGSNIN